MSNVDLCANYTEFSYITYITILEHINVFWNGDLMYDYKNLSSVTVQMGFSGLEVPV